MPGAFGPVSGPGGSARDRHRGRGPVGLGHRRRRPGRRGDHRRALHHRRRAACGWSPTTSGSSAPSCATSGRLATVEVVPASTPGRGRAGRPAGRGVPLQRPGRPRRGRLRHPAPSATCSGRCRCSGSAWAISCWRPPSAASTYKLPFGHHGGNHPVRRVSNGAVEITSQNHNYAVADGSVARRRRHPRQPQRRRHRGAGLPRRAGLRRPVPPRGRARPPRRQLPVRGVPGPDGERRLTDRCPDATTCSSILVIGSGPIVIGQACEFDYSGTQACRVLMEEGYRVILANSNPATIMTDPAFAHRTYVEPLTVGGARSDHRAGAPRRRPPDPRRADGPQPGHDAARAGNLSNGSVSR